MNDDLTDSMVKWTIENKSALKNKVIAGILRDYFDGNPRKYAVTHSGIPLDKEEIAPLLDALLIEGFRGQIKIEITSEEK